VTRAAGVGSTSPTGGGAEGERAEGACWVCAVLDGPGEGDGASGGCAGALASAAAVA
jgi:hypothetical protein